MAIPSQRGSTGEERSFDHYARLVRRFLQVPVALVTLVESDRQVFPGVAGLPEPYLSSRQTPLTHSFCQYVVADELPLIVSDAHLEPRLSDNLAISELGVTAYAGWPLVDASGRAIGSLCAIDSVPRDWNAQEVSILEDLALACSAELQASRRQAQESENLARTIFDSVDVGMAFYDVDETLVMANSLAERVVTAAGGALEKPPARAGARGGRRRGSSAVALDEPSIPSALRGDPHNSEMEWIGAPGNQMAIVASSQRVVHTDGSPWGTLVVAHDVTELARSLSVKDEFISTVSHELRTPLTSILGYLEVLTDELDVDDGFVADTLSTISRNATQLQERVQQLLDTADRRRQLVLASADVSGLARHVAATFGEQARSTGIVLTVDAPHEQWATIDARQVEQAVENLVSNALKFTSAPGRVRITVEGDADTVTITVSDDGLGMSPDEIAQACTTFWRSERVVQAAVQGFGIGLTLVRDIAEAHRGSLDIRSSPDLGTTIRLSLPHDAGM